MRSFWSETRYTTQLVDPESRYSKNISPEPPVRSTGQIAELLKEAGTFLNEHAVLSRNSARSSLDMEDVWDETTLHHLRFNAEASSYL